MPVLGNTSTMGATKLNFVLIVALFMLSMMYLKEVMSPKECTQTIESMKTVKIVKKAAIKVFKFDPLGIKDCSDIYKGQNKEDLKLPQRYKSVSPLLDAELKKHGGAVTGHVGLKPLQAAFFLDLVNASFINTVCETGFNAGHSAMVWLTGNEKCKVYSFDIGGFRYSNPMSKFLQKEFPGRLETIWGDSKKTIPEFTKKNPQVKCDLVFVDGGHNYPEVKADLRNLRAHANTDFHVLMVDDYTGDGINKAWTEELKSSQVEEKFHCHTAKYIDWSIGVGKYVNLP